MTRPTPPPLGSPLVLSRPLLPPIDTFVEGLRRIWDNRVLSNRGTMVRALEIEVQTILGGRSLALVANGALGLEVALGVLDLSGEVITTAFSFAATANAIVRSGLRPVFVDIEPETFTIDPAAVEAAITPQTTAILGVHVFGVPCRVDALADIARRHRLKLVYDAAHAFGVTIDGRPIADFGDMSIFSLHATKPFQTAEGGIVVTNDPRLQPRLDAMINHGIGPDGTVAQAGTNAKMSELHALLGLTGLAAIESNRDHAAAQAARYRDRLGQVAGVMLAPAPRPGVAVNYSYFTVRVVPTVFGCGAAAFVARLAEFGIGSRRYFHPLLSRMPAFRDLSPLPVASAVSDHIVALPVGASLRLSDIDYICDVIAYLAAEQAFEAAALKGATGDR